MITVYVKRTPEQVKRDAMERLEMDARRAGLDLNTASEQMFRVSPEFLTDEQKTILRGMFYEAYQAKHKHHCELCGSAISCDIPNCTETGGYDHCDDDDNRFDRPLRVSVEWR
jgi:hypothetical protein